MLKLQLFTIHCIIQRELADNTMQCFIAPLHAFTPTVKLLLLSIIFIIEILRIFLHHYVNIFSVKEDYLEFNSASFSEYWMKH